MSHKLSTSDVNSGHTTMSRNLTGKPPTVPSDGMLFVFITGDPVSNGSLLSFGDEASVE
jgi:hypothetical protein